jgi:hypothetical protein
VTGAARDHWTWALLALAAVSGANALWMLAGPALWYHELPAAVPDFGPYNEHFVRDIGCAFATFAAALAWAAFRPVFRFPLVAAAAIFLVLHAVLHVFDTARGFVARDHWWIDAPGVYLPAVLAAWMTWKLRPAGSSRPVA